MIFPSPTLLQIFYCFVFYSFAGWLWEVVYFFVKDKKFVNRGFLNGPFCPIYGFGAIFLIYGIAPRFADIMSVFAVSFVILSLIEYTAGFLLERIFNGRWWDYSDKPFNIRGYISLKTSLFWAISAVIIVKFIHPCIEGIFQAVGYRTGAWLFFVFCVYVIFDLFFSAKAAVDLGRTLKGAEVDLVAARTLSKKMAISAARSGRERMESTVRDMMEAVEKILAIKPIGQRRIAKAFPSIVRTFSKRLADAFSKEKRS